MDPQLVKEQYNKHVADGYDYEYNRWHKDKIRQAGYDMTLSSIKKFVLKNEFNYCLELGPGHGTWTKELTETHRSAKFDLVDISKEMLSIAKNKLKDFDNVNYFESNFLKFESEKKYDFFFSSRVIEYIPSKDKVVKKIFNLLNDGGTGFVITKTPKYLRAKLLKRKITDFHSGQINPALLISYFKNAGFVDIKIHPVTLSLPFFNSSKLNLFLYKIFGEKKMNIISEFFSESYCIKFKKK